MGIGSEPGPECGIQEGNQIFSDLCLSLAAALGQVANKGPASEWRYSTKGQGPQGTDILIGGPCSESPGSAKGIPI